MSHIHSIPHPIIIPRGLWQNLQTLYIQFDDEIQFLIAKAYVSGQNAGGEADNLYVSSY